MFCRHTAVEDFMAPPLTAFQAATAIACKWHLSGRSDGFGKMFRHSNGTSYTYIHIYTEREQLNHCA